MYLTVTNSIWFGVLFYILISLDCNRLEMYRLIENVTSDYILLTQKYVWVISYLALTMFSYLVIILQR